jgi:pilus biogenesis lipoprotein CpaD
MITRVPNLKRSLRIAAALLGASAALGACTHTDQDTVTGSIPNDYRQRHPIVVQEANRTTEVFVGTGRGGLTSAQRSDIAGLAETWLREGTGGIVIDMPVNTPNARVAADSLREIRGILAAAGVPPRASPSGIIVRPTRASLQRSASTIRASPLMRVPAACGPKISDRRSRTRGIWRTGPITISVAPPSATLRRWSITRPISFNRAQKARPTHRAGAWHSTSTARARPQPLNILKPTRQS